MIPSDLLTRLQKTDTPTVCNALELLLGGRRSTGFTRFPVVAADPTLPSIVGYARCVKIRAASPPTEPAETVLARRMAYYEYVAAGPAPSLVVIEDTDWPHCIGAFWGELHVAVHKGLGLAGTLTNGLLRDLGQLDPGYQVIAGAVGPSHAFVHVTELDVPVTVLGLQITPGQLVHADRHGATIIPETAIEGLDAALDTVIAKEKIILDVARAPGFNIAVLKEAWLRMLEK